MSEETLNNLFAQARQEVPETSTADVLKWIGGGTLLMMLAAYVMKFKILFISKPLVMISSIITVAGITTATIALVPSSEIHNNAPLNTTKNSNSSNGNKHQNYYVTDSVTADKAENKPLDSIKELANSKPFQSFQSFKPFEPVSPLLPLLNSMSFNAQFCGPSPISKFVDTQKTQTEIGEFHTIEISGTASVVLTQGDKYAVTMDETENEPVNISVTNVNGVLKIVNDPEKLAEGEDLTIYVSLKNIDKISCTGVCSLSNEGILKMNALRIESSEAADIDLKLDVKDLVVVSDGASELNLELNSEKLTLEMFAASTISGSGTVNFLDLNIDGAADFKGKDFKTAEATVKAFGASSTKVHVTDKLDVVANDVAKVKYKGSPKIGIKTIDQLAHLGRF